MEKYFTPEIEDIRVGYECEMKQPNFSYFRNGITRDTLLKILEKEEYKPYVIQVFDFQMLKFSGLDGVIRVPYLTKEQIEKEGWKCVSDTTHPGWMGSGFEKGNYLLRVNFINQTPMIGLCFKDPSLAEPPYSDTWRLTIPCKDINTFRQICKLLNIN